MADWGKGWGVARKLRVQFPGAIYHVLNRGNRREPIFKDDADRARFLETLGQCCTKTERQVHAWCLMNNHFHLVIETPKANLIAGMKWFLGTYTARFNPKLQNLPTSGAPPLRACKFPLPSPRFNSIGYRICLMPSEPS